MVLYCATQDLGALGQTISLDAIELNQTIQAMDLSNPSSNNSIPLLAIKETLVRAYFSLQQPGSVSIISGTLHIQGTLVGPTPVSMHATKLPINTNVVVTNDTNLPPKRVDLTKSLNFSIKLAPGSYKFWISDLVTTPSVACLECGNSSSSTTVDRPFFESPFLRIKLMPVQYYNSNTLVYYNQVPDTKDYAYVASWVRRAYPVSENKLDITTDSLPLLIDAKDLLSAYGKYAAIPCNTMNPQLANRRNLMVAATMDATLQDKLRHTHFHGLVADHDPNGNDAFKRGCTDEMTSGQTSLEYYFQHPGGSPTGKAPQPNLIGQALWDPDSHYGDWYAGHELAHALGLPHADSSMPSWPMENGMDVCDRNIPNPTALVPYDHGQLSNPDEVYAGNDAGDSNPVIPISAKILPGTEWHDLMTYCKFQWISDVTYRRIWCRLHEENGLSPCPTNPIPANSAPGNSDPPSAPTNLRISANRVSGTVALLVDHHSAPVETQYLQVTAGVNLKERNGRIFSTMVIPSSTGKVGKEDSRARLLLLDSTGHELGSFPVIAPSGKSSLSQTGELEFVTVEAPFSPQTDSLELVVDGGGVVDRRFVKHPPPFGFTIIPNIGNIRIRRPGDGRPIPEGMVVFEWDSEDLTQTYIVWVSQDQKRSWTPIIMNLAEPVLALPRQQLSNSSTVYLKITANDGFNDTTTVTSGPLALP
jgi:hypothetical protein